MVAPKVIASQYIVEAWRGAVVLSFLWFLHRWKTNVFSRAIAVKSLAGLDRERLIALDKLSSVGLLVIGIMALAEACGVPLQSIITVGGIGGTLAIIYLKIYQPIFVGELAQAYIQSILAFYLLFLDFCF